jgi:hypothetical protein
MRSRRRPPQSLHFASFFCFIIVSFNYWGAPPTPTKKSLSVFKDELAALTRRSKKLSSKSFLRHVAEIVVKMKKCTFLESKFLLASCKFVDNFADGDASRSRESLTCPNLSASLSSYTTLCKHFAVTQREP